jgi:carboxyl-terminal processing protease
MHPALVVSKLRAVLLPAFLGALSIYGLLGVAGAIADGAGFQEAVILFAFVAALVTGAALFLTPLSSQPEEASLWAGTSLWLSLFAAALVDRANLLSGDSGECIVVACVGVGVFLALWLPYLWPRRNVLAHASAWTLVGLSLAPYGIASLAAWALNADAWPGVTGALPTLGAAGSAGIVGAGGPAAFGYLSRQPVRSAYALMLAPVVVAVAALELPTLTSDAFVVLLCLGGAVALALGWGLAVRRLGRIEASAGAAALVRRLPFRGVAIAGAVTAATLLWGFALLALVFDATSAQVLAGLRSAGFYAISEVDLARAMLRDEYLWRTEAGGALETSKPASPLEFWARAPGDRWSAVAPSGYRFARDQAHTTGTGLTLAVQGREAVVVLAPQGSPGHSLGIRRGDRIVRLGNWPAEEDGASIPEAWVLPLDFAAKVIVASPDGEERTVEIPAQSMANPRVVHTTTLDAGGRPVGYLVLKGFDRVAEGEVVRVLREFRAAGARALVLDLRYNPGGSIRSVAVIAGAILGERGRGRTLATTHNNRRHRDRDHTVRIRVPEDGGLGVEQLVVITSAHTCSASELLVKALEPYLPVATIGATTCGKPVGSRWFVSGDWAYALISFEVRNARGEGGYFQGLEPTCPAPDDLAHDLGDSREASLAEALRYIETGKCSGRG